MWIEKGKNKRNKKGQSQNTQSPGGKNDFIGGK